MSDLDLARRILAGDESACEAFFADYFPRLYRFARRRLEGDEQAVEDVVQSTLIRAVRKLHTYRGEAALFTWLCTLCRREISGRHQHLRRTTEVALVEDHPATRIALEAAASLSGSGDPECETGRRELSQLVQVTLDHLPGRYGQVLEWRYIQGLSVDEESRIGWVSGFKAAESRLAHRARQSFRDRFPWLPVPGRCRRRVARLDRGDCDGGHRCERPRTCARNRARGSDRAVIARAGMRADVPPDQRDHGSDALSSTSAGPWHARASCDEDWPALWSRCSLRLPWPRVAVRLGSPREMTPAVAAPVAAVERLEGSGGRSSSGSGSTPAPIRLADTVRNRRSDGDVQRQPAVSPCASRKVCPCDSIIDPERVFLSATGIELVAGALYVDSGPDSPVWKSPHRSDSSEILARSSRLAWTGPRCACVCARVSSKCIAGRRLIRAARHRADGGMRAVVAVRSSRRAGMGVGGVLGPA